MENILVLNGAAKKNGNTVQLLEAFIGGQKVQDIISKHFICIQWIFMDVLGVRAVRMHRKDVIIPVNKMMTWQKSTRLL